jgi:polar amino acid transport system substrate-binding protein
LLKAKAVCVLAASAAQRFVEGLGEVDVRVYPGNVESFRDLANGRIDAVVVDLPIALYYLKNEPGLKTAGEPFAFGHYGIGVRKEDPKLLAALNDAIVSCLADGSLRRIYSQYGLWDEHQERLDRFEQTDLATESNSRISTLREWPRYLPLLLKGAVVTIQISLISMALAVGLGLVLAITRLYGWAPLRWLGSAYVEVIRGTPLLIQLYLIYYGLPNVGIRLNAFVAAVIGLGLNYAAYEAENYRAGIEAIPKGQMEAALALGMTRWQSLRRIILPQAFRLVIPPMTNDFIALFKDSSLVSVITMVELTKVYGMLATTTYDYIGLGLMTAAIYFGLSYPASLVARGLEKRLRYDHR